MRARALVFGVVFLYFLAVAHPASAEDWWGRKLANQPENFLFGYVPLINTASCDATATKPVHAIPVRISASFGFVRAWVDRSATGFTALDLRKPVSGESAMMVNGVLYPVEVVDMTLFDKREDDRTNEQANGDPGEHLPQPAQMRNLERVNQETCRLAGTVTRMMTTFQQGMVTLQRMRTGGRQEVLVQHVTVSDGGQAVGSVGAQGTRA